MTQSCSKLRCPKAKIDSFVEIDMNGRSRSMYQGRAHGVAVVDLRRGLDQVRDRRERHVQVVRGLLPGGLFLMREVPL